jgi:hypothetical protein
VFTCYFDDMPSVYILAYLEYLYREIVRRCAPRRVARFTRS